MSAATILRGPLLRWAGDPFAIAAQGGDPSAALGYEPDGAVLMRGGRIEAVGAGDAVSAAAADTDADANTDTQVIRTGDKLIAPGFVDAHVHYPQIGVIASYGAQLLDWLTAYTFPEESRFADPAYAAAAARGFFDETLRHGVTTVCSFCTSHPASVTAFFGEAQARGLRALGGKVMMDRHAPPALLDDPRRGYDESLALAEAWDEVDRLTYVVTPRFAPTSSPAQLEAAGALRARLGARVQTHLSENHDEIAWVRALFPEARDYLDVYERAGLLGPGAIFGHAIHLTEREAARLAETGAAVAHCPTSNQFLGSGACDVAGLIGRGVAVGAATDTGGGTSYGMFDTMKSAYELAQSRGTSLSAAQLWWLTTAGAAAALDLAGTVGDLQVGADADVVVLDPAATPLLARRTARAQSVAEQLFALVILGDDRAVAETWAGGRRVHRRGAAA